MKMWYNVLPSDSQPDNRMIERMEDGSTAAEWKLRKNTIVNGSVRMYVAYILVIIIVSYVERFDCIVEKKY